MGSSMSADLYSDLTIWLGMKNYPKMTPHLPYPMHWFPSYMKVIFHISWFVQWPPHHWIGHEKLPQNDPLYVLFHALVPKLHGKVVFHVSCQLTAKLHMKGVYHVSWFVYWPHHWIGHEKLPQNDPSYVLFHALVPKLHEGCLQCQLICTVTSSPLDWVWKTTPK